MILFLTYFLIKYPFLIKYSRVRYFLYFVALFDCRNILRKRLLSSLKLICYIIQAYVLYGVTAVFNTVLGLYSLSSNNFFGILEFSKIAFYLGRAADTTSTYLHY